MSRHEKNLNTSVTFEDNKADTLAGLGAGLQRRVLLPAAGFFTV
jgi:hypothetical protein